MQTRSVAVSRWWASSYARRIFFYITALLSAIIIMSAVASYLVMRNQIMKMESARTLVELRRTASSFSTMFASSIIPAAEQVFETAEVNGLIYGSTLSPQQLVTASQLLDRFQLANPLIDSIAVYNSQRKMMYSTRYGLLRADDPRNAVLLRIFRQIKEFRLYRFIPRRDGGKELLTVILGTRPYTGTVLLGGLVVNVSERAVRNQLLGNSVEDGSRTTIIDSSGIILSDATTETFGTDAINYPVLKRVVDAPGESGSFTVRDGRSDSLVIFFREPLVGWTFVSSTPNRLLFSAIAQWRDEIIFVFSVLLLLSVALALTTTRRVSLPLERLMVQSRVLQADLLELGASASRRDDIALVSETLDLLNQRLHDLTRDSGSGERSLARIFGRVLLEQSVSDEERTLLRTRLFDSTSGEIWTLSIVVDRLDAEEDPTWHTRVLGACRALSRRLSELSTVLCAVESERGIVAAAVGVGEEDAFAVPEEISAVVAQATASEKMSFTIGVSDPVSEIDELSPSYDSALEAVRCRFREGRGGVIPQERRSAAGESYALPEEALRRLGEQARLLNEPAVSEAVDGLLEEVKMYAYGDFVFLAQNLLHTLERVFAESGVMNGRELAEYRARVFNIKWIETAEDVAQLAMGWYRRFIAHAEEGGAQRRTALVADVRKVIENNLDDTELSTKGIAGRLRISVNYLRASFKSATGDSVSSYITRLRIERCKELLESSDMPVKEVARAVGFSNYNYFFTLFKKQTGHTPQEYQRRIAMK